MIQYKIRICIREFLEGCVDLKRMPENTWLIWLAPIIMMVLTGFSLIMPLLLLVCILLAVYFDVRMGGWTQTILMGVLLIVVGTWLWGVGGICLTLIAVIPTLIAILSFRKKISFAEGLIYALVAGLFSLVISVFVLFLAYQQDPMTLVVSLIKETIRVQEAGSPMVLSVIQTQAMMEWVASMSYDINGYMKLIEEMTALTRDELLARVMPTYETFIRLYAPTAMVGYTMLSGFCSWIIPGFAIKKRIRHNRWVKSNVMVTSLPPAFTRWSIPRSILLICTLLLAITLFIQGTENMVIVSSINALSFAAETVLLVQGTSFAAYWLRSKRMKPWLCWLIIIAGMAVFNSLFVMLGLADGTMQLRKMIMMRKHSAQMQELVMKYREDPKELDRRMREFMSQIEELEEEEDYSAPVKSSIRQDIDPEEIEDHNDEEKD